MKTFLDGKKTYILAVLVGLEALSQYLSHNETMGILFASIAAFATTLRHGME